MPSPQLSHSASWAPGHGCVVDAGNKAMTTMTFGSRTTSEEIQADPRPYLVVLDDDPVVRLMISVYFGKEGFRVGLAETAEACRLLIRTRVPDLIFMDIHLPDANGISFAEELQATTPVAIIFVTQLDCVEDVVAGLESSGDDYVTKPVRLRELLARVRAVLRRRQTPVQSRSVVTFGGFVMDMTRRELASHSGDAVALTRGEFDLLAALVEAGGQPRYRDYLSEVVSIHAAGSGPRTVDVLVARLRKKLKPIAAGRQIIVTVGGIGYRLGVAMDPG